MIAVATIMNVVAKRGHENFRGAPGRLRRSRSMMAAIVCRLEGETCRVMMATSSGKGSMVCSGGVSVAVENSVPPHDDMAAVRHHHK
jgi:hypothetical protein